MSRGEADASRAARTSGLHYLDEGLVEGDDPLAPFGAINARKAKGTDGCSQVADIMVNSTYRGRAR